MYPKIFRLFLPFAILWLCLSASAQRTVVSIDDNWTFQDNQVINLPHTWNTDAYHRADYDQGEKKYTRVLTLGKPLGNRRYYLKIDAASKSSAVYVNGHPVGKHQGGYTAHHVDITPYLHSGDNILQITVDNATPHVPPISADFTFMGGLYRHVWLISTPPQHFVLSDFGASGVRITPRDVSHDNAKFDVDCELRNDANTKTARLLVVRLIAPDSKPVAIVRKNVRLQASSTTKATVTLPVFKPRLWSPDQPNLYTVVTQLTDTKGQILDEEAHRTAALWTSFDAQQGFRLNGKPLKLRGICLHQDQYPYGVAMTDDMHRRDLKLAKEMGANFIRLAHYPQAESILDECDRLGLMVWEEIPMVNYVPDDSVYAAVGKTNLKEMIRQHYNHPSVILWGYMNEILLRLNAEFKGSAAESAVSRTLALAGEMEQIVRQEDSRRNTAMAVHGSDDYNKVGLTSIPQVVGWNLYQGWYGGRLANFEQFLDRQQQEHPTHPVIVSEWGAGSDLRLHSSSPRAFDFSMEYQQAYIEHYLPVIESRPFVAGAAYWNFVDFSSASREESMPFINNKGLLTADRRIKDVYYYFKAMWRHDTPVAHIATRDWPARHAATDTQTVKVYTNQEHIELTVNGASLGLQKPENGTALFKVKWREGQNVMEAKAANGTILDVTNVSFSLVGNMPMAVGEQLCVNVGSKVFYQSPASGLTWLPDQPYQPGGWGYLQGTPQQTNGRVVCTDDTPLLQTMMAHSPVYRFDVGPGVYELQLQWADKPVASETSAYLLGKDGGKSYQAHILRKTIAVTEGRLTVDTAKDGLPQTLSAISIRRIR